MHLWGIYVHMFSKYESCAQMTPMTPTMTHNGQNIIVLGSLVDKPNEAKKCNVYQKGYTDLIKIIISQKCL